MFGTGVLWALAMVVAAPPSPDPRIELIELQIERAPERALARVDAILATDAAGARALGFDYLRAHLLLETNRRPDALEALVTAMSSSPALADYSRFRLAEEQIQEGHPKIAAGLLASLLANGPPRSVTAAAARQFRRAIEAGGDCRLLRGIDGNRYSGRDHRQLVLAAGDCAVRGGEPARGERRYFELLEADRGDEVARLAAERLVARPPAERDARAHMLIGLSFFDHREFDIAIQHLARTVARLPDSADLSRAEVFETRYALARSHFWQRRWGVAAAAFSALAGRTREPGLRAQVLYQQGRCHELEGEWDQAIETFRAAHQVQPSGGWADSALMSQLRLLWRSEREADALAVYDTLEARRRQAAQTRALVFFASSDLVRGRADRAGAWLATASRLSRASRTELAYWQGRLAELEGQRGAAVDHYLRAFEGDPHHPFAAAARRRLAGAPLAATARAVGRRLAGSSQRDDLYRAWQLRGDDDIGRGARRILAAQLAGDSLSTQFINLDRVPPASWPLWRESLRQPEELLLALGLWQEGASAVLRHFPVAEPRLAFTGGLLLAQAGATQRSLYIAEVLKKRVPSRVPAQLLPESYRRLLYPFSYSYLILRQAGRRKIDPYLLAAIIREESRFDARAFSGAAARGLTQFVFPTARRLAPALGIERLTPEDLDRPEVAIALGAAYLGELSEHFGGDEAQVIAAYNAGEPQAALWRRYCFSDDPAELYSKVTFRETRNYLLKVLTSRGHYRELYEPAPEP